MEFCGYVLLQHICIYSILLRSSIQNEKTVCQSQLIRHATKFWKLYVKPIYLLAVNFTLNELLKKIISKKLSFALIPKIDLNVITICNG